MIRYCGSKAKISRKILLHFPSRVEGLRYVEPFCGPSYVFRRVIREKLPFQAYSLSDKSAWVVNYLLALRNPNHGSRGDLLERLDELRERLTPESEHEDEIRMTFQQMKPLARQLDPLAYLFLASYANGQYCMGARRDVASFHAKYLQGGISTCTRAKAQEWREALQRATVTWADAFEILPTLEPNCFVFLDPPWVNHDHNGKPKFRMYHLDFGKEDHYNLAEILRVAKFKFAISYGDKPPIRELYRGLTFRWLMRP